MYSLLYVDDEQGLLDLGQLFLESDGEFRVTTAISGNEGLRFLAGQEFDAVVSDYQMPEMNGIELLKKVRKSYGNIPFILFTGRGREEVVIEAINNGVDFYLQKGGDPKAQFAELAHKVRQAVTRRRAEAALSESEKRLSDIINFLPDATFAIDTAGVVIAWNRAMERMTGVRSEDVLGKGDYEYALPFYHERRPLLIDLVLNDSPEIAKKYPFVKREGKTLISEITIPHFNDGKGAALWFTASPLYDRKGTVAGAIESIREITERKRAETALNESERRFRELADLLPQGIYEADNDGLITYANRLALEMFGYTAEEIETGVYALNVIAPVDRERAAAVFSRLTATGDHGGAGLEYLAVRKDGTLFPVSIFSSPVYRDGRIAGLRGVIEDITERKKAEERLISANREYTSLLDQIQDIYYFSNMEGRLVRASRSLATLLGYDDIAECIGRSIADDFYLNPSDRKPLLDEIRRNGRVTGYEIRLRKKDGTPVFVEVSSHLAYDHEGKVTGVEGTFHDITARKKAEEELRAAYEQLTANEEELKEQYNELAASGQRIRESEQKYRTVFETTGTAMLMIEDDTTISLVNSEFCRLSGYTQEEIENKKKWTEFVVPEDRERMLARHRGRRTDTAVALKQYEFRFVSRSGEIRHILLSIDIIPGTKKSVASLLDITERKKAADELQAANEQLAATGEELRAQYEELALSEKRVRLSEARLKYMLGFYEFAQKSEKELIAYAIEGAGIVTGSPLGYLAFLNDDETELSMYAWSKNAMAECSMVTKPIVYQVEKTGLWGEAVRQRRPVITNDYAAPNPAKKGYPEGHPHIVRHMNVPVIDNDHIVLVAGVANKESGYTETDVNELLLLVQGLWENLKRRRAEEIKQESEAKFRNVIENAPVGMHFYSLEADGSLMFRGANPGADRILGVDHTRFIGKTIETAFPSLVTTEIPAHYRRIAAEGGTWQTDQITYDGQQIRGAFAVTAFQTRPGEMIATFVDITARKKTEMALREAYEQLTASEEELREQYDSLASAEAEISARRRQLEEIASNVPGVVFQFFARPDGSRGLYYAGSHAREIFGLEPDLDNFFSAFTDGVHPDDRERFLASIDEAVGQRADWHFEGRFIRASGEIIWFEGRSTPVSRGDELVFSGVLSDITGRKKMEAAILESEERYRSLVELSPVAVVVHSRDKILFANPEALRLVGATTQEEVVGRDILPFIHPDDRAMAREDFRLLYEEGRTVPLKEERLLRLNGEPFNVEVTASPIQFQGGSAVLVVFRDITRRRQAEAALAESERKYRTVFETAEEGIWIVDAGFRTVSANRKMQELFGYTEEEMRGRPVWDFVPSDEAESVKLELSRRPQGIPGRYERGWVRKDSSIIWCLTSATPLFSPSGEFLGSFGMFTDITERRRAEDALRASEKKYRLLVENIPFGITLIDADHRIVMSNTAQGQMFQTDERLWPGRYCYREFEKRDTVCAHCPGTKAMATGVCEVVETEGVRDDGTRFHARIHAIPLPDDEGKATRFIEVVEDITERKKAEDALRQDEEKYRTLIETTGTGYVIIDQDGHVLDANPEYVRLTGHSRLEEITGRNVIEWTAEHEKERNAEAVRQCLRDGFIRNFEIDYAGRDGTIIPIEINATVLRSEGSVHILTLCRDISDRQKIQDALKTSAEDYQTLLQTAMDGFCIIGMDGAIIDVNEAFCRSLGYSRDEALALSLRDVEARETDEDTSRHMGTILRKGYDRFETQWRRKDGRIVDTEVSVLYTGTHGGRFITFSRDITERRNAEHALRESEARFRAVIDQSFQLIGLMTPDGTLIHVNRAALALIGASEPDVVNRPFWETPWWAHSEELREKLKDAIRRAASGETVRFEATHPAADGHLAYIDFSVKPVVDPDGRIRYLIPEGRDITEIKQTERALQASEEQHRILAGLLDLIPASVTVHDAEGRFLYANQKTFEYHGYTKDEFYRINLHDLDVPESERLINDRIRELRERGSASFETQHFRKDRSQIPLLINAMMTTWGGEPVILSIATDITEHRNIRNALQQSEEKYRTLVESSFDGIAIHQDGAVVYVNRTGAMLLGSEDPEVFIGKPAISIIAPAFRETIAKRIQESAEKPLGLLREQFLKLDGTPIDVDVMTSPTTWNGRPASYVTFRDITAQVKAEESLRESEEKFRTLVEVNRDIIYSLGTDGTILYISPQTETQLGYRPDEMIGQNFANYIHPDDLGTLLSHIREHAGTGTDIQADRFRVRRNDGAYRWYEDKSIYISDHRGSRIVAGTIRDITDEKAAQDALRESEEKFRTLVETTSDFIWEVDTTGKYTYVSPQVSRILGYEPGELIGKTPFELMPPDEAERISAEFNLLVRSGLPIAGLVNRALRKDGSVVILETSGTVRTADDGRFQGYRGIDRDITERTKTEEALREKTEELNRFFSASLDLFCIADTDGHFRRLNPEWEKTLGYTLGELEGHRFLDFVHPDDLPTTLSAVADLRGQKNVLNFTNRFRHKDGTYRWIEWRSLPMGSLIFAAARDITARHDAAERTARISALKQDLLRTAPPEEKLKRITDAFVDIFGADFARIWISGPGDLCSRGCIHADVTKGPHICRDRTKCLHLIVSSGRYTHTDGDHRRVPFGAYKIGRIATGQESQFITNDVTRDPRVHNHPWAASLGLVSFAGFRLVSADGKPIGVLAFFSRLPVLPEIMDDLADMATTASQVIQTGMAEQALRESESRLSSILHGSPVLQFVIDRGHRVISWNRALEEYSGIRADDIIGTDMQWRAFYAEKRPVLADLLVDQDIEKIDTWYAGKFAKSRYVEGAYTATDFFPHMGTSGKWLSFTAAPVRDEMGTIIGAVETLEDITERINAENALRQSEEWARTILDTAQTGIIIVDADTHRILEANKKALDLLALPAESVTGSVCHRFICPADEGKCPVTDCKQTVDTSERILITADGTRLPVLKTVVQVTMGNRDVLVESFVDISEHKRSESAIREANRKLNLLSSITRHDVANQLTVVHGYTQLAAMKEPDPVVKDFLAKIEAAVVTIQRQIEFTKQYQELGVHAPAWFNLGDVIRKARPGNVRLRCSCDTYEVFADPMIGRVFYNLFDNAMKYGEHVTLITAGCKQQGDELLVTFADNGVGIPLDEKRKIFEKGYGKNTGFGLFLAREILAITGITIHESGKEGKGARFEIVVPKGAFRKRS
ncbi:MULTISPECIES: PAS domain S-box protein [unclassified Methanoregula]|uniref:PAS domain S-box protein n=1 Tax=unclassified Methanoregula TaxID=2649730 RepID=UPI0009CE4619|nr:MULTISPECIES: PAS domain S-box protein [unclassified Methanoregula]OPX64127.1 MAG: putative diguanylate cyclase [Methanoregula sp. PtaB.Bin085]OPY34753.1 MAG: putative diguanylate cyclase [Methanoregula sp. PtaU1.Bin006]